MVEASRSLPGDQDEPGRALPAEDARRVRDPGTGRPERRVVVCWCPSAKEGPMTLRSSAVTRLGAAAFAFCSLTCAPAWGFTERLAAIPIPAALRPTLLAACEAWGRHIEDLIEQHRLAGELSQEDIDRATDRFRSEERRVGKECRSRW